MVIGSYVIWYLAFLLEDLCMSVEYPVIRITASTQGMASKVCMEKLVGDVNSSTPWWMLSYISFASLTIKTNVGMRARKQLSDCPHNVMSHLHLLHECSMINLRY